MSSTTEQTEGVVRAWFAAVGAGDLPGAFDLMADDIEWVNHNDVPGEAQTLPWIGTFHGKEEIERSFEIFHGLAEIEFSDLTDLVVQDDQAFATLHERARFTASGRSFETQYAEWLKVSDGLITNWRIYVDPTPMIHAIRGRI